MFKAFLNRLPQRLLLPYRGYFWMWHIIAIGVTAVLVLSGFDWWFFQNTRNGLFYALIMVSGIGGFFVPIFLPIILYVWGKRHKNKNYMRIAAAVAQATIISWIIVAVYKTFTGRIQPEYLTTFNTIDTSTIFRFGFFQHGIFWGWPSHHTVVVVAAATVLCLAVRKLSIRVSIIVWAIIVSAGAAIGYHWFSDVIAGILIGVVTGVVIWRDFVIHSEENKSHKHEGFKE